MVYKPLSLLQDNIFKLTSRFVNARFKNTLWTESLSVDGQFIPISTNRTTISHIMSLNTGKTMIYAVGIPGPVLGQAHKFGEIKPNNGF